MNHPATITSPDDSAMGDLCARLAGGAAELDRSESWPGEQLELCRDYGVYRWFLPHEWDGQGWSEIDVIRAYLRMSAACLTTTFILTQRTGACQRIAASENTMLKQRLLPELASGQAFATLGISHLTTSRRHVGQPILRAEVSGNDFFLNGFSPWVTGANHADVIVTGATLFNGQQILLAVPTDLPGMSTPPPARLIGLSASQTGEARFDAVRVGREWLLAGPAENVMKTGAGAGTGGLQTSTLAIGLTSAIVQYLNGESLRRPELSGPTEEFRREHAQLELNLMDAAAGVPHCSNEDLRVRANSLVLRASQAALASAKGTGYIVGHPAGRWCREALFFLVWSCPQPVMAANLCELAGLE